MHTQLQTGEIAHQLHNDKYSGYSYKGAYALAEHLEEYEESTGENMELDIVAIRCEFTEYNDIIEIAEAYFTNYREEFGIEYDNPITGETEENSVLDCDGNFHDETLDALEDWINRNTILIKFEGGVIIQDF